MSGYRTYISAALLAVLGAVRGLDWIDQQTYETLLAVLTGGGLFFLRKAVEK